MASAMSCMSAVHNELIKQWKSTLTNKFSSATSEIKGDKNVAIKLFYECVELEKTNTNIIDKRFYSMKQILLLKSEEIINDKQKELEILNDFEELLKYYDPVLPTQYISTNDVNNALRLIFNALIINKNIKILLKLTNFAITYFLQIDTKNDEFTKMTIQFTLNLLQKEYLDKLDMKYTPNIQKCDHYEMYNAVNDFDNKIVLDLRSFDQFKTMHIIDSINIDISKELKDEFIFDTLFKYTKTRKYPQIYCYFNESDNDLDELKQNDNDYGNIERIQKIFWEKTFQIIPFYIYQNGFNSFYTKYYPFLCEQGTNIRSSMDLISINIGFPNQIINDRLFLGNIKHSDENILKILGITHIVNCTPAEYHNEITKCKDKYFQIKVIDQYNVQIDEYFDRAYKFIHSSLKQDKDNKVFVHCRAGKSRSATIVLSYLMKNNNLTLNDALKLVKSKRSIIEPNEGFMQQLQKYEKRLKEK